jgi:hypothetical protein
MPRYSLVLAALLSHLAVGAQESKLPLRES